MMYFNLIRTDSGVPMKTPVTYFVFQPGNHGPRYTGAQDLHCQGSHRVCSPVCEFKFYHVASYLFAMIEVPPAGFMGETGDRSS